MFPDFVWTSLFWIYVAATLVQLVVWWGVFGKFRISDFGFRISDCRLGNYAQSEIRNLQSPIPNPQSPISIILCARNEAENLRQHLPKILEQQYAGEWEIVVVDDASEDETLAVLHFFQEKNPRLRVVQIFEKQHVGKKHALAQGIAAAKFDNLLLTDADCEPASPYWLKHMADKLREKPETEFVLGYGPFNPTPASSPNGREVRRVPRRNVASPLLSGEGSGVGLNTWSRFETAQIAIQYFSFALAGMPYMGVGRNLAFKLQAYERAGGFSAHLDLPSGDDDLLVNAAATSQNVAVCLHPESFMYSDVKKTWREWARQKRRHLSAGRRYRLLHRAVLALVSGTQVLHFFLFAVLLLVGIEVAGVVSLFLLRGVSVFFIYRKILPKLHESGLLARVPIFDVLLAVYYGAFVPVVLILNRKIWMEWK